MPQSSSMRVDVSAYHSAGFRVDLAVQEPKGCMAQVQLWHTSSGVFAIASFPCKVRGQMGSYPIKLFYTSNIPIILQATLRRNTIVYSPELPGPKPMVLSCCPADSAGLQPVFLLSVPWLHLGLATVQWSILC